MIRIVAQHKPNLYSIIGFSTPEDCPFNVRFDGVNYYRAETKHNYILYRASDFAAERVTEEVSE